MAALEILLKAKDETGAAFASVNKNLKESQKGSEAFGKSLESTTSKAGKFANSISQTSTTLARSADTLGLPTAALRALDDVADVASLGLSNLSNTAVGLNAATAGAAGAGLALGTAIGKLLLMIPGVTEAMDSLAAATLKAFTGAGDVAGEAAAKTANWSVEAKKAAAIQKEILDRVTKGMSAKEIQALLFPEPPKNYGKQLIERAKLEEEATKKRIADAKKASEEAVAFALKEAIGFDQANQKAEADRKASQARMLADQKAFLSAISAEEARNAKDIADQMKALEEARVQGILKQVLETRELQKAQEEAAKEAKEAQLDAIFAVADAFHELGGLMGGAIGTMIEQVGNLVGAFGNVKVSIDQIKTSGGGLTGVLAKIGGFASIAGTVLSVGKGLFDSLFGGAKKAREEMDKLRNSFIQSQGGLASLTAKAKEAGIALDAMFKAKSAKALEASIANIKAQLDLWAEGQNAISDAMEKYNISVSEMGPLFAQQELDKQAAEVAKAFEVLKLAGADASLLAAKMGDDVLALVNQYKAAGLDIPEALRPVLQAMLENGELVDENGQAYATLEDAGIHFAQSMTDAMKEMMSHIEELIRVLAQGFHVPVNFDYNTSGAPSPSNGGGKPGSSLPEFASGGPTGSYMGPAYVHPGEYMLTPETLASLERVLGHAAALASSASGGGGSAGPISISIGGRELDAHINNRMRQRGIRSPQQQRGGRSF